MYTEQPTSKHHVKALSALEKELIKRRLRSRQLQTKPLPFSRKVAKRLQELQAKVCQWLATLFKRLVRKKQTKPASK